jgi:hypothetical protein
MEIIMSISKKLFLVLALGLGLQAVIFSSERLTESTQILNFAFILKKLIHNNAQIAADWIEEIALQEYCFFTTKTTILVIINNKELTLDEKIDCLLRLKVRSHRAMRQIFFATTMAGLYLFISDKTLT